MSREWSWSGAKGGWGCKIPTCLYSRGQRGNTINLDTGQALTITIIGIGTAFSLLTVLSILTAALHYLAKALSTISTRTAPETVDDKEKRDKALAATIAVNIALSQGHVPGKIKDADQVGS